MGGGGGVIEPSGEPYLTPKNVELKMDKKHFSITSLSATPKDTLRAKNSGTSYRTPYPTLIKISDLHPLKENRHP